MHQTKVIVVRHGETNWNAAGRIQGFLDVPLNERGLKQARRLASTLQFETFDAVYSSDLLRAVQTAQPLARRICQPIQKRAEVREWHLGCLENLTTREARQKAGDAYAGYRNMSPDLQIPGGESFRTFYTRCIGAMEDLVQRHAGQTIVLFTHGGVVINFIRRAQQVAVSDRLRYYVPNTARLDFTFQIGDQVTWVAYHTDAELVPWLGTTTKA